MVTVDRRSDGAAALCYAALTPPGARAARVGEARWGDPSEPPPRKKKQIRNTPSAVFRAARSNNISLLVSHAAVAWETDPKLETLNL